MGLWRAEEPKQSQCGDLRQGREGKVFHIGKQGHLMLADDCMYVSLCMVN